MKDEVVEAVVTTDTGRAPRKKFPSAKAAWSSIEKMIKNQEQTQKSKARIQGLCDGNQPYSSSELRRLGQAWRSNVNFREAESIIDNNSSAYWELMYDTSSLAKADIEGYDLSNKTDLQAIISDEFTKLIMRWEGFYYEMAVKIDQMLKMGRGILYWPDEYDWRFRSCKDGSFLLPKRAKCNVDDLPAFGIRDVIEISDAYDIAEDVDGVRSKRGWNIKELRQILVKQFKSKFDDAYLGQEYQEGAWLNAQQKVRNGDWNIDEEEWEPLKVVHLYAKEATGKISHYIISEIDTGDVKAFLYDGHEDLNAMPEAVAMFFYHFGDGYAEGVKGLGHRIFSHVEAANRLMNGLMDGALLAGSLVLKQNTGDSERNLTLTRIGPITMLPAGTEPVQSSFQPPLNHMIAVRNLSQGTLSRNSGIYDVPDPDSSQPRSATGEKIKDAKEARFSNNQVILFYIQWDRCLREVYRRVTMVASGTYPTMADGYEQAKKFVDACEARGVDADMLLKARITAQRAIGLGSPSQRRQSVARIFGIKGSLSPEGQYNIVRDVVAAEVGYENSDRYITAIGKTRMKDHEDWQIAMEENDLHDGYPAMITSDQNQFKHLIGHIGAMSELVQQTEQDPRSIDIEAAYKYLSSSLDHIGEHLKYISQDPGIVEMMKQAGPIIQKASAMRNGIEKQLRSRAMAEQQKAHQMAQIEQDNRPEMVKVQNKAQIDFKKAEDMAEARRIKSEASIEQSQKRTDAEIDRLSRKTEAEIELERYKASQKNNRE